MLKLEYMKEEILEMYDEGYTFYKIAKEINEYEQAVSNLVRKYRDVPKKKGPYEIDENYFEKIDSVDKAYFFGLIAADGSVVEMIKSNLYYTLNISLSREDKYILELMKSYMKAEAPVREYAGNYIRKDGTTYTEARFVTSNQKICNDLIEKGVIPRKSNRLGALTKYVEEPYVIDYIRGYFDGNGSIYQTTTSGTQVKNYVSFRGSEECLTDIKNYLGIKGGKVRFGYGSKENTGTYEWKFGAKQDIIDFKNAIYHENIQDLYLKRKVDKFLW